MKTRDNAVNQVIAYGDCVRVSRVRACVRVCESSRIYLIVFVIVFYHTTTCVEFLNLYLFLD